MHDLNRLLSRQIATPLAPAEFYRELLDCDVINSTPDNSDNTLDIPAEIESILTSLYRNGIECDLTAQLLPALAGQTIDPNSTRQPISAVPPADILEDTHPQLTLGSTITRPSPIERLNEESNDFTNTMAGNTLVSGDAWLASDDVLQRHVLLKEPTVAEKGVSDSHKQFIREAQITGQLEHPNILPVYSLAWSTDNTPYYTMKLIDGTSFSQHIRKRHHESPGLSRNTLKPLLDVIIAVSNAMHYAHTRGVYHGRLNSESISLGKFGEVMVLNWSEAIVDANQDSDPANFQCDLRSIASLVYEVITGAPPISNTLEGIANLPTSCPKPLASILRNCYLDEPFYPTLAELIRDLRNYSEDLPVIAHSSRLPERIARWIRKHPLHILYITTVSVLILFFLVTEFFILTQANEAAELALDNTQRITKLLLNDNRNIEEEQKKEIEARDNAFESFAIAETALQEAKQHAELALVESLETKTLELESIALEQAAKTDKTRAINQDAAANLLLQQAKQDEAYAIQAKDQITTQTIATHLQQIVHYGARGQREPALAEAFQLSQLTSLMLEESSDHHSFIRNLLGHSYIPKYHLNFSDDDLNVNLKQLTDVTGRRIILQAYSRKTDKTQLTVIADTLHPKLITIDGRIDFHFTTKDSIVLLSNEFDGCTVTILNHGLEPSYGRLSHPCTAACMANKLLYACLEDGQITIFSTEQLTQTSPIHRLPIPAHQIDISNRIDQLAVAYGTKARIVSLSSGDIENEIELPSESEGLWFNANNGLAILSDQYYINQFVLGEPTERRIRFRPPTTAKRLTSQAHHDSDHFLLFDDGTLTKCDRSFKPTLARLRNFRDGQILFVGPSRILVADHKGTLRILDRSTLNPIANPIRKQGAVIAARLNSDSLHVCTNHGTLTTYSPPMVSLVSEGLSLKDGRYLLLDDQTPVFVSDSKQVSSPDRANLNYTHPTEITEIKPLHKGTLLAIKDRDGYTVLLYDGKQLLPTLKLPSDTDLNTVQLSHDHNHIYACNSKTLFEWKHGTSYNYPHPSPLMGFINLTLGQADSSLLISSSNVKSIVQKITIDDMNYGKPIVISGFVRDCFWNDSNSKYHLLITNSQFTNRHQLFSLDESLSTQAVELPVGINRHIFNEATQTLTIATSDHRLVNYSIQTNEITDTYTNCPVITAIRLDTNNNLLLIQNPAEFLIVDANSLNPLSPLIQLPLSEPVATNDNLFLQIQMEGRKPEFISVHNLLATEMTVATMQKVLDDESAELPRLELK